MLKNLSISNFENIIVQVRDYFKPEMSMLSSQSFVIFLFSLAFFCIAFFISFRIKKDWQRRFILSIILVLLIRFIILGNPFAWIIYSKNLSAKDVGWRQKSVIEYELLSYYKKPRNVNYLAVGTSQTEKIYSSYSQHNNNFKIFSLAGLSPLDYLLYKDRIFQLSPHCILLYLSEADMAKKPEFAASKYAPGQYLSIIDLLPIINTLRKSDDGKEFLIEMLAGEIFPEYKYSFIFKGITTKIKSQLIGTKYNAPGTDLSPQDYLKIQVEGLKKDLSYKSDFNFVCLEKFLEICGKKEIPVVIVEGQYNPLAYTKNNINLNRIITQKLSAIPPHHPLVFFLSRENSFQFKEAHYSDGFHVKPEAGLTFVSDLMSKLPPMAIKKPPIYKYGLSINFEKGGNAEIYLGNGWSNPEKDFTWTDGKSADIFMTISKPKSDVILNIDLIPFVVPEKLENQRTYINVNGKRAGGWIINRAGEYKLTIPKDYLEYPFLNISFKLPDAASPAYFDYNEDKRTLGLAVRKIILHEK